MDQDILLCDLDAFFTSVEQIDHPELRGKPVIVGGDPNSHGVVSTCSNEARKYGVRFTHAQFPEEGFVSILGSSGTLF